VEVNFIQLIDRLFKVTKLIEPLEKLHLSSRMPEKVGFPGLVYDFTSSQVFASMFRYLVLSPLFRSG